MKYKKIKSLTQYNEYCSIHEKLLVKDDEKYQDEIELLEVLIEEFDSRMLKNKYEKLNPVELLRTLLLDAGMNQNEFSKAIGISRQLVNDVLKYRRRISRDLVIKLSDFFSMSQEAFGRNYDLALNKKRIREENASDKTRQSNR